MRCEAALVGPAYRPPDAWRPSMPGVLVMSTSSVFSLTGGVPSMSGLCLSYKLCGE